MDDATTGAPWSLRLEGSGGEEATLSVAGGDELRAGFSGRVGAFAFDLAGPVDADDFAGFWFELRALVDGKQDVATFWTDSGWLRLEVLNRGAVRLRLRDPDRAGHALEAEFPCAGEEIRRWVKQVGILVMTHPPSGTPDV